MSIDQLSRILRLSHAGTVRLVDRLVERNLVEKRPSALDRRIMSLALTTDSWQQRDKLLALRRAVLTVLLNQVAPEDLAALEHVAETIAAALPEDALSALTTCRFCDERRCIDCLAKSGSGMITVGDACAKFRMARIEDGSRICLL
jgi:MarR family transcriptional regulator, negative regulator of the multidrug operon emrRAB